MGLLLISVLPSCGTRSLALFLNSSSGRCKIQTIPCINTSYPIVLPLSNLLEFRALTPCTQAYTFVVSTWGSLTLLEFMIGCRRIGQQPWLASASTQLCRAES